MTQLGLHILLQMCITREQLTCPLTYTNSECDQGWHVNQTLSKRIELLFYLIYIGGRYPMEAVKSWVLLER